MTTKSRFVSGPRPTLDLSPNGQLGTLEKSDEPYKPRGNSPCGYIEKGIRQEDILLGEGGFLERSGAALVAGPSGIGKSSIAMQMGCCWACNAAAFDLAPPKAQRIVMMQNEDTHNDLVRQSQVLQHLSLSKGQIAQVRENLWIETVRGKIGPGAIRVMRDLVNWHNADILILNPLSAYHDGDISQNRDNIQFLYGQLGALLDELQIGLFAFHHKGKPPKNSSTGAGSKAHRQADEDVYFQIMYEILGGSTLTNFFRGIITVSPIGNGEVFKFTVAKRFEESGWTAKSQMFKWDSDRTKRLWIPASHAEAEQAKNSNEKYVVDLVALLPITDCIPRVVLEQKAFKAGFKRTEFRALLEEAQDRPDDSPERVWAWNVYNPGGLAKRAYSRRPQPDNETHEAMRDAKRKAQKLN